MTSGTGEFDYLAAPGRRALAGAGVRTHADLARLSEAEVAGLHGMGPNALRRLREHMAARSIRFAAMEE
jgi:hypothetical protein